MAFHLQRYFCLSCMCRVLAHFFKGERKVLPFQTMAATSQGTESAEGPNTYQYSASETRKQTVRRNQGADGPRGDMSDD